MGVRKTILGCLDLAVKHNHVSIAFPNLKTGNYKFDTLELPGFFVETIKEWRSTQENTKLQVTICLSKELDAKLYRNALEKRDSIMLKDDSIYVKEDLVPHGDLTK